MGNIADGVDVSATMKDEGDFLGGFGVLDSGLYDLTIKYAYLRIAGTGAKGLIVRAVTPNGKNLDQTFWFTSGTAKGCKTFWTDKQSLVDKPLKGYTQANDFCRLALNGKGILKCSTEERVLKLYSFAEKAEIDTKVDMIVELEGKMITAGVTKKIVDKNKDSGTVDAAGKKIYLPTGETREENDVDKFFHHPSGMTITEAIAKEKVPKFKLEWAAKFEGVVIDETTKTTGTAGAPGATHTLPQGAAVEQAPLFS